MEGTGGERLRGGAAICRGGSHYAMQGGAQDTPAENRERVADVAHGVSGNRLEDIDAVVTLPLRQQ